MADPVGHLLLNGFMAAGKSTVGPLVAGLVGMPFVDVDEAVEQQSGQTIQEIFGLTGEQGFRKLESEVLTAILRGPPRVIAVGGASLMDSGAGRALAESTALIVTLSCSPELTVSRIIADGPQMRPVGSRMLQETGAEGIVELRSARSDLYDPYPLVSTEHSSPAECAKQVAQLFHRLGRGKRGSSYQLRFPADASSIIEFWDAVPLSEDPPPSSTGEDLTSLYSSPQPQAELLSELLGDRQADPYPVVPLVTDTTVNDLYLSPLEARPGLASIVILPGEAQKTLETVAAIYARLQALGIERHASIVALGGGVVCDLAGFVASTFLRGLDLTLIPTTLLAQVDAAVGGKTGVDLGAVKNGAGTFWPASNVSIAPLFLRSLPQALLSDGLAEIVKMGFVRDAGLVEQLESLHDPSSIIERTSIVRRAVRNKVEVVQRDPLETGVDRAILNFGHTIGHAFESVAGYRLSHGRCVALGMVVEAKIACQVGSIHPSVVERLQLLLSQLGLPVEAPKMPVEEVMEFVRHDKKRRKNAIRMVILTETGSAGVHEVDEPTVRSILMGRG